MACDKYGRVTLDMLSFPQESFSCSKRLFEGILAQEVPSKGACLA